MWALHVVDAAIGFASIVYGSLLCTQFEKPAMTAATFWLIFGSIHFSASVLGIFSLVSNRWSRWGLVVSAFAGPYMAFNYLVIVIAMAVDSSGFFSYVEDHKDVMYLGENAVDNLTRYMPLVYAIFGVLVVAEASR